jgi:5-methylcytosine-specific restriction endonuclease McrA
MAIPLSKERRMQHTCAQCTAPFSWTRTNGTPKKYCSDSCARLARGKRVKLSIGYRDKIARQSAVLKSATALRPFSCHACGQSVAGKRKDAKYCSPKCAYAASAKQCTKPGCSNTFRARGLCSSHYNAEYFPGSQKKWPASTTTRRTKDQRRRALKRGAVAEPVNRDAVGDRDQWKCGVCKRKVDNALPYPDPMSPSLDHIVPLSEGGEHTYANCRISHLWCNVARSNRGGGEQLMLWA